MRLIWRPRARRELRAIIRYISERNPDATDRLERRIYHAVDVLKDAPLIHRPGRIGGTREAIVHPNYIVVYHVKDEHVVILTVLHARQQYP